MADHETEFRQCLIWVFEARHRERGVDEKLSSLEEREIAEAASSFTEILAGLAQ